MATHTGKTRRSLDTLPHTAKRGIICSEKGFGVLIERYLAALRVDDIAIPDVVRVDGTTVRLFLDDRTDPARVTAAEAVAAPELTLVNGYPCLTFQVPPETGIVHLRIGDRDLPVAPGRAEHALFAGRNVLVAERNGESPGIVGDWLLYHVIRCGLSGVVLVDRAAPGTDTGFLRDLESRIAAEGLDCPVVVLRSALPLGKPGHPPEAHPINVAEAPGKDRMEIPPADPWRSPLGFASIYELVRSRFLGRARAVANIDVYDLLTTPDIFDRVQQAPQGVLPLAGRHCFPWRLRPDTPPHFGDHICVQFDADNLRQRWCVAPAHLPPGAVWRMIRIGNAAPDPGPAGMFWRCMVLRHPTDSVSRIVPKTALIEDPGLLSLAQEIFDANPVRTPDVTGAEPRHKNGRRVIITCMKNEGPFILEWLAYHRAIGFDDFLIYTNDCDDGTDAMFDLLERKGLLLHRENPYREKGLKPQHAALQAGDNEAMIQDAEWVTCIDVDEYINIKTGDGTLDALFAAAPDANMIAMTWRLFGNGDVHEYRDGFITEQFLRCAPEFANKPHQAWGFKTLFQNIGLFKKLGVHRPKGLNPQLKDRINWINGSGKPLPEKMYRNAWRSDTGTYGYDLVQLNHYAVRSAESFLVKRDRGRVNHVDRDQGLAYWFRMNNNAVEDRSILPRLDMARAEYDRLLADPEIRALHAACVASHRAKIDALRATENYADFYAELTGPRLEKLSRLHPHFGANVFLQGPEVVPDAIIARDPEEEFFFSVESGETTH